MVKCVYCLENKNLEDYSNREHVIPQCFGRFEPDNLVLHKSVCNSCNQYFGKNLELYLGRDTFEGIERYRHGIKPKKPPKHKRLKFKIAEGELAGIIVSPKYSDNSDTPDIDPVTQVGIFNEHTNKFDYFEPDEIPSANELKKNGRSLEKLRFDFIYKDQAEIDGLIRTLGSKGYKNIECEDNRSWPEFVKKRNSTLVEGEIKIDRVIYRALSKIAFNYLTYQKGNDFVLSSIFDPIRKFVRYGDGDSNQFFFVNQPPILENDRRFLQLNIKETEGHLIVLEWNGRSIQSRLSLFNTNTYLIKLCDYYNGLWLPLKAGHHFDISSKEVNKLFSVNRRLMLSAQEFLAFARLRQ